MKSKLQQIAIRVAPLIEGWRFAHAIFAMVMISAWIASHKR